MDGMIESKKHALVRAGIVAPSTACASLPLQITFSGTRSSSYDLQFSTDFFSSPWPLDHAPLPLTCRKQSTAKTYRYYLKNNLVFSLVADSLRASEGPLPASFDLVTTIQNERFRVVQHLLPPLHPFLYSDKDATPILSGSPDKFTATNMHPLFAYNSTLDMMQLSPPVFRALAMHMTAKATVTTSSSSAPVTRSASKSFLFASFLVSIPTSEFANLYCLLQFMLPPPPSSVSLLDAPFARRADMTLPLQQIRQWKEQASRAPFFIPQPVDLSSVYVASNSASNRIVFSDSYLYGTMGLVVDRVCFPSSQKNGDTMQVGNAVVYNRENKQPRPLILLSLPLFPPHASAFHDSWWGVLAWTDQDVDEYDRLTSDLGCMDINQFLTAATKPQSSKTIPSIASSSSSSSSSSSFKKSPINIKDVFSYRETSHPNSMYLIYSSRALETCDDEKGIVCHPSTSHALRACKSENACHAFLSPKHNAISALQFQYSRNLLFLPAALDFNQLFLQLGRAADIFRDTNSSATSESYLMISELLCDLRMRADALHFLFENKNERMQVLFPLPITSHASSEIWEISNAERRTLFLLLILQDFLVRCQFFACDALQFFVAPGSTSAALLETCLSVTLPDLLSQTIDLILDHLVQTDSRNRVKHDSFFDDDSSAFKTQALHEFFNDLDVPKHLKQMFFIAEFDFNHHKTQNKRRRQSAELFVSQMDYEEEEIKQRQRIQTFILQNIPERDELVKTVYKQLLAVVNLQSITETTPEALTFVSAMLQDGLWAPLLSAISRLLQFPSNDDTNEWLDKHVYAIPELFQRRVHLKNTWAGMLREHKKLFQGNPSLVDAAVTQPLVLDQTAQTPPRIRLTSVIQSPPPPFAHLKFIKSADSSISFWNAQHDVDTLGFQTDQQIGSGTYANVYLGDLFFSQRPELSVRLAMKLYQAKPHWQVQVFAWDEDMQGYRVDLETLEVVVMTLLNKYGRWEEDPYIVSPLWLWTAPFQRTPFARASFMEYFGADEFENLYEWGLHAPATSKEIVMSRLDAYYHHMAFESPIHLIMHDNHTGNILIAKTASTSPRTAVLVLLDQAISCVSIPRSDLDVSFSERDERNNFMRLTYQHVLDKIHTSPYSSLTLFSDLYELVGEEDEEEGVISLPKGAMAATRRFVLQQQEQFQRE